MEPIKPEDVQVIKNTKIPDVVIQAANELIVAKWSGKSSTFTLKSLTDKILELDPTVNLDVLYSNHHLDIEDMYRKQGWGVTFDKPGYNESYDAKFTFTKLHLTEGY